MNVVENVMMIPAVAAAMTDNYSGVTALHLPKKLHKRSVGQTVVCRCCGKSNVTLYKVGYGTYICKQCKESEKTPVDVVSTPLKT